MIYLKTYYTIKKSTFLKQITFGHHNLHVSACTHTYITTKYYGWTQCIT